MLKKLTLLAAAVAALVAFAVPASASANEWLNNGKPLEAAETVELSGPAGFAVGGGVAGAHAVLDAVLELEPGSTGTVTELTVKECTGTGLLAGLTCHGTPVGLPWTVHCNANGSVTITSMHLTNVYTPEGATANTTLKGNVVATGTGGSLNSVTLAGEGVTANGNPATVTGTLTAATQGYKCAT